MRGKIFKKALITIGVVAIFALVILMQSGWRPEGSLVLSGAKISIEVPLEGSVVFLDGKEKAYTSKDRELVSLPKVSKGEHTIVVHKENFWPWAKTIQSQKGDEFYLKSFHLPQRLDVENLELGSEARENARRRLLSHTAPSSNKPVSSADEKASLWTENNKIFVEWKGGDKPHYFCKEEICDSRIEVLNALSNIISADFLKDRNDVVIFSNEEGIFAIEVDKTETQNFQPIWRVRNPKFVQSPDGLFVEEGGGIYFIAF